MDVEEKVIGCDRIQNPPKGKFNSDDLTWYPCSRRGPNVENRLEAWIPSSRLADFLEGEHTRSEFQCCFNVQKVRTVKSGDVHLTYWCSYGPKDEREPEINNWAELQATAKRIQKGGQGPGSRHAALTVRVGMSMRRGCRCHFNTVTTENQDAILISWMESRHVERVGHICHGVLCASSAVSNAQMAPKLSKACLNFVERLLRSRVPPSEILAEHQEHIADTIRNTSGGERLGWTRDMHLISGDIRNIQARLRKDRQIYHHDDAQAVRQWVQRYPEFVIQYVEQSREHDKPFSLVISTLWMLQNLAMYGHKQAVCTLMAQISMVFNSFPGWFMTIIRMAFL